MLLESLNGAKFILVALNLIILYVLLRKILFKPVAKFMDDRTKSIENAIEAAKRQKKEAGALKEEYEAQLKKAREDAQEILREAKKTTAYEHDALLSKARGEADAFLSAARLEIQKEREAMLKDVREIVLSLALTAASRVVSENMDTVKNEKLVEEFLHEAGVA